MSFPLQPTINEDSPDCTNCLCTSSKCHKSYERQNGRGLWTNQAYCDHLKKTTPCKVKCTTPPHNQANYCPCLISECTDSSVPFANNSILYMNKKMCDAQRFPKGWGGCKATCLDRSKCLCKVSGCTNESLNGQIWTNKTYCDSLPPPCKTSCDCEKKGF